MSGLARPSRAQLAQAAQYVSAELADEAGTKHSLTEAGWLLAEVIYLQQAVLDIAASRYLACDEIRDSLRQVIGTPLEVDRG